MSLRSIEKLKKTVRTYVTSLFILSLFAFVIAQPHLFAVESTIINEAQTEQIYQEIIANNERVDDGSLQFENIIVGNTGEPTITYRVTGGDTLLTIANNFGTTVDSILRSNSLDDPNNLNPGQTLVIEFDDAVLINVAESMKVSEFTTLYSLSLEEFRQINYFDTDLEDLEEGWQVFVPLNQIEAEERGLINKEEFFAIDLPFQQEQINGVDVLSDGEQPETIEEAIEEQLAFIEGVEDTGLQQVINADGSEVAPEYEQTVIDSEETQRRLEQIKRQELEAIAAAEAAEAQAKADAEAAEQARIEAEAARVRAEAEQTAQAQRDAEAAAQRAQEAKALAEREAAAAATERARAVEQQRLSEQAEIVAAAPAQVQCGTNQCGHNGSCYDLPANAYCTDTDPANAWRCVDGYTEAGNTCLSAEEIKRQQESVPAGGARVLSQYYLNPHKLDSNVYGRGAGHCTAYAAYKWSQVYGINIRNFRTGNAKNWVRGAKNAGFRVDNTPAVGSLMVTDYGFGGRGAYGHVMYVEAVDYASGMVTVTDMNYRGRYIVTKRTEAISKAAGFIHPN